MRFVMAKKSGSPLMTNHRVDSDSARVREERPQHLGDAAAGRRGVDVDDGPTRKHVAGGLGELVEPLHALRADERRQPFRSEGLDVDLPELHGHSPHAPSAYIRTTCSRNSSTIVGLERARPASDWRLSPSAVRIMSVSMAPTVRMSCSRP